MKDKGNDADVVTDEQQSVLVDDEENNSEGEDSEEIKADGCLHEDERKEKIVSVASGEGQRPIPWPLLTSFHS